MRYIGSKGSVVNTVYDLITERVQSGTFCDPFGGVGIVGAFCKQRGFQVWSGDVLKFAHYFQISRINLNAVPCFTPLLNRLQLSSPEEVCVFLNSVIPRSGWITAEYSSSRLFLSEQNATAIDACWEAIREWQLLALLTTSELAYLLASLINSMDKVANTAGTYYAHLKKLDRKASQLFKFEFLPITPGSTECKAVLCDATELVATRDFDVLYLDPPYNQRNYAAYYHLPESIAQCQTFATNGKSGIPVRSIKASQFNKAADAYNALHDILSVARYKLLAFHYSDDGLIAPDQVRGLLSKYGTVEDFLIDSKGYSTISRSRTIPHHLYLVSHD